MALHRPREIEESAQAMLTDHGADFLHAHGSVLRSARERGLPHLAQQRGAVLADVLNEQSRPLLAHHQALGLSALAQPFLERAAPTRDQRDDGGGGDDVEEPVRRFSLTVGCERLVGEEHETRGRVGRGDPAPERVRVACGQRLGMANHDQPRRRQHGQRQRGVRHGLRRHVAAVEDLAIERRRRRLAEQDAAHDAERVIHQLRIGPMHEHRRRQGPALGRGQEGRVVHPFRSVRA